MKEKGNPILISKSKKKDDVGMVTNRQLKDSKTYQAGHHTKGPYTTSEALHNEFRTIIFRH